MKPMTRLWVLLALLLVAPMSSAQTNAAPRGDFGRCDRCLSSRGCPGDADGCRLECQRLGTGASAPSLPTALETCLQECARSFDLCNLTAQQECRFTLDCLR